MNTTRPDPTRHAPLATRGAQRREEILEQAIVLFARDGYADTDLQVLADVLGVGKGTLYRHFGSKQELFLAAADRVMQALCLHIDLSLADVRDPLEQIVRGIHAYLGYFDTHPEAVEMLIQERAQFRDRKKLTYFEYREVNVERWRAIYRDLIAQGRVRPVPVERLSDTVGDLLYGTMFVNYIAGRRRPPAEVAAGIIDVLFNGILSDAERPAHLPAQCPPGPRA